MNIRAGICEDCGNYWTVTGGGLNADGQCLECARRLPVSHGLNDEGWPAPRHPSDAHDLDEQALASDGAGLGV